MGSPSSLDDMYQVLLQAYGRDAKAYAEAAGKAKELITKVSFKQQQSTSRHIPYPTLQDPRFQEKIYNKKEFHRNQSTLPVQGKSYEDISKEKCSLEEFQLTPSQKFLKNFFSPITPYRGVLLYHSVGVGKTCTAISIAEQYLQYETHPKRVLVILSSNIKDNFKQQIFDMNKYDMQTGKASMCTGTTYPDMVLDKELISKETLEKRINRLIKERYQFVGYKELVVLTQKIMDAVQKHEKNPDKHQQRYEEKIKELFSDRLIIVDEAHNLRMPSETGKKQISTALVSILQIATNTRLVLMTATPMFNSAKEIIWMMNMLLTNDRRPNIKVSDVFDKTGNVSAKGTKLLEDTCRGYVSYMRGENPFSFPFRLFPSVNGDKRILQSFPSKDIHGKEIPETVKIKHLQILGTPMSVHQKTFYQLLKKDVDVLEDDEDVEVEDETITNDLQNTLQISNVCYPVDDVASVKKTYGRLGFLQCFDRKEKKGFSYKDSCKKQYGEILSYDLLDKYAPKIKSIVDSILTSKGIVFVYSQYYYSGIYPLAIALEHIGFSKYGSSNITKGITVQNKLQGKKLSYVILSRDKEVSPNNDIEINAAKSLANKEGDVIKVVLVTKVGTEGIDFKNIREVHLLEPWFNLNRSEQIIGRAVRQCSHVALPIAERNVTIYFHATTVSAEEESIDLKIYRMAETKQKQITQVQKVMKETAIDCSLNRDALVYLPSKLNMTTDIITSQGTTVKGYVIGDKEGSFVCDFGPCELTCRPSLSKPVRLDESTFDPSFIVDDIDLYKKYIAGLFAVKDVYTFDDIQSALSKRVTIVEEDVLAYALQELLDQKQKIRGIAGRDGYLLYRGDTYIFQPFHVLETRLSLEEREEYLRKKLKLPLQSLAEHVQLKTGKKANVTPEKKATPQKKPQTNVMSAILTTIQENKALLSKTSTGDIKEYVLVDAIVDRLDQDTLFALVSELYKKNQLTPEEIKVRTSLYETGAFLVEGDKPKHFYNPHDGNMYTLRADGSIKQSAPLDFKSMDPEKLKAMETILTSYPKDVRGFIEFKKDGAKFKIRDNAKGSGYVCTQTSSLNVELLKERIQALHPTLLKGEKHVKKNLCDIYEWVLRSQGKNAFRRFFSKN